MCMEKFISGHPDRVVCSQTSGPRQAVSGLEKHDQEMQKLLPCILKSI